jgi:hypothetical protein
MNNLIILLLCPFSCFSAVASSSLEIKGGSYFKDKNESMRNSFNKEIRKEISHMKHRCPWLALATMYFTSFFHSGRVKLRLHMTNHQHVICSFP